MALPKFISTIHQRIVKVPFGYFVSCPVKGTGSSSGLLNRGLNTSRRHYNNQDKHLTNSAIMVQDGTYILEMPCIVQVINGDFEVYSNGKTKCGESYEGMGLERYPVSKSISKKINFEEESEMTLGFIRCNSVKEILNLLNTCPEDEITPSVALAIIKRIFDLENDMKYRNISFSQFSDESHFTFARTAVIKRLTETISSSQSPQTIIDALRVMSHDSNEEEMKSYIEHLCTEILILATEGKLNLEQVCELIKAYYSLGSLGKEYLDKAWAGVNENQEHFTVDELCCVMSILPLVKNSRAYLYNFAERRLPSVWQELKPDHIIRIAHVLVQLKMSSSRLLGMVSEWTNLNIHILTEGNLRWIVYCFLSLKYTDDSFQRCLYRYMNAKKINIKDQSLVSIILDYFTRMRIRHTAILDLSSEYFIHFGDSLSTSQISSIMISFGYLNYIPKNAYKFFSILELQIQTMFSQFPPNDLLDILLSCTYLRRYPLNFVKYLFNPYFFDRLHLLDETHRDLGREKLIILDSALTLEAPSYQGPLLPLSFSHNSYWQDARILTCVSKLKYPLIELIGNSERISTSVLIPSLPASRFYTVDIVVDLSGKLFTSKVKEQMDKYAIIIHLPEHFDITESHLTGPQEMKLRHLQLVGYIPVSLNYRILNQLLRHDTKLKDYIKTQMILKNVPFNSVS